MAFSEHISTLIETTKDLVQNLNRNQRPVQEGGVDAVISEKDEKTCETPLRKTYREIWDISLEAGQKEEDVSIDYVIQEEQSNSQKPAEENDLPAEEIKGPLATLEESEKESISDESEEGTEINDEFQSAISESKHGLENENIRNKTENDPFQRIDFMMPLLQAEISSLTLARANEDMQELIECIRRLDQKLEKIYASGNSEMDKKTKLEIETISLRLSELKGFVENRFERRAADYFIEVYDLIDARRKWLENEEPHCSDEDNLERRYCNLYLNKIIELLAGLRVSIIHS